MLEVARAGIWSADKAKEIPSPYLERYMLKGRRSQEDKMKVGDEIRSVIEFQRMNLNDAEDSIPGKFDLIFCRNVVIYFSAESRMQVMRRLLRRLQPTGYLFVGHAESLGGMPEVRGVKPTVYCLRQEPSAVELSGARDAVGAARR